MVSDNFHFSKLEKLPSGLTAIPSLTIGLSKKFPQSSSHQSKNVSHATYHGNAVVMLLYHI
jgi:hypothetical protein